MLFLYFFFCSLFLFFALGEKRPKSNAFEEGGKASFSAQVLFEAFFRVLFLSFSFAFAFAFSFSFLSFFCVSFSFSFSFSFPFPFFVIFLNFFFVLASTFFRVRARRLRPPPPIAPNRSGQHPNITNKCPTSNKCYLGMKFIHFSLGVAFQCQTRCFKCATPRLVLLCKKRKQITSCRDAHTTTSDIPWSKLSQSTGIA